MSLVVKEDMETPVESKIVPLQVEKYALEKKMKKVNVNRLNLAQSNSV